MKKIILLSFSLLLLLNGFSQGAMKTRKWRKSEKDSLLKAQAMFQDENFLLALPIFDKLVDSHPKEVYLKYVTGICGSLLWNGCTALLPNRFSTFEGDGVHTPKFIPPGLVVGHFL